MFQQEVSIRGIVRREDFSVPTGLPRDGLPLLEAVSLLGNIDPTTAAELIDLGAVYTGREIKVRAFVGLLSRALWSYTLARQAWLLNRILPQPGVLQNKHTSS